VESSATAHIPIADLISLRGRVAVITGAAMGIGAAIARRFSEAGDDLLLIDKNPDALAECSAALPGEGRVERLALDVNVTEAFKTAADKGLCHGKLVANMNVPSLTSCYPAAMAAAH
jgi:NAD(P)-dependent dehydrogenase (short-subunit alcohol dehydrogenase family)